MTPTNSTADPGGRQFLFDGPADAPVTILLAHGAGAPMDSPWMNSMAQMLAGKGFRIVRFEFEYMAARRINGKRKPPPRAEKLMAEYLNVMRELDVQSPLIIGGKSMGGRIASMVADELFSRGEISGLVCLGYPFHPPGKPERLRTKHLEDLRTPALIFQGTRDPFGSFDEVPDYPLSDAIRLVWLEDGDHDFKPRKKVTGLSIDDHFRTIADAVGEWVSSIVR